jgi:hypothetical protein
MRTAGAVGRGGRRFRRCRGACSAIRSSIEGVGVGIGAVVWIGWVRIMAMDVRITNTMARTVATR